MTVEYEWCLETRTKIESEDEIIDHHHDSLPILLKMMAAAELEEGHFYKLCLVRDKLDKFTSVDERAWAYVDGGVLPDSFEDAFERQTTKVPNQYHEELVKAKKATNPF